MDVGERHGDEHVAGDASGWQPTAVGFCEGTVDVIAVPRNILHDQNRRGGVETLLRPRADNEGGDRAVGKAQERG